MDKPNNWYKIYKGALNIIISVFLNINVTGIDNFDENQQYVVVANHSGWLDGVLVLAKLPKKFKLAVFAEAEGAHKQKYVKKIMERSELNIVTVDRANQLSRMKSLKVASKIVKNGESILIFPEGRFNQADGKLYPFYKGSFFVAKMNECAILPIYMRGSEKIYFRRRIEIAFGKPIEVSRKDDLEDIAVKTYKYMNEELIPDRPKNDHKKPFWDITNSMIGEIAPPPENPNAMIADGTGAYNVFHQVNQESKDSNRFGEGGIER